MDTSRETPTGRGDWSAETDEHAGVEPDAELTAVTGARIGAQLIDIGVLAAQFVTVLTLLQNVAGLGFGRETLLYCALTLPLYGGLLEGLWNGQTIGKRLLKIRVVDGTDSASLPRTLVRNSSAVLLFGAAMSLETAAAGTVVPLLGGFVVMAVSDRRQRVLDHVAGTYVVAADESVLDPEAKRYPANHGGGAGSMVGGGGDGGDGDG